MKSPHIWIIIALLAIIIAGIIFWPKDRSPEIEQLQQNITREYTIKRDLQEKLSQTLARIRTDSLQQAIQAQDHTNAVDSLSARINDLKRNPTVITVLEENVEVRELVESQDSLITVQAARIDTLTVNLSDLRVDLQSVTENFEAQLAASDRIIENQGQILNQKDKEIRKHRREKRAILVAGIVGVVAALFLGR